MRILLITHYYPPEVGAAAKRLGGMVRRWRAAGAEIRVIAPLAHYPFGRRIAGDRGAVFRSAPGDFGEQVIRVPFVPTTRGGMAKLADQCLAAAASVGPIMTAGRPDVVIASLPALPSALPALVGAARWRVPLIIEMRDAWPDVAHEAGIGSGRGVRVASRLMVAVQRHADAVVTVSEDFAAVLGTRGVAPERLHCIPNGVDIDAVPLLSPVDVSAKRRLRVLYLGTHGVSQHLDTVVDALARVGGELVEARFVGHGTEKARLIEMARRRGAPITFMEPQTGEALWDCYRWADTCLAPLRAWHAFRHTVPSKVYEVLACGRHLLLGVDGEAARIVAAAGGAEVVEPENVEALASALRHLAWDRTRCRVGDGPRAWVAANASLDVLATRYMEVVTDLVTSRRASPTVVAPGRVEAGVE